MLKSEIIARGIDPRLYAAWTNMRDRCNNPRGKNWPYYGGRGIRVCRRWNKFENFAADMGPHPGRGWTLDRKNGDGNYCKSNCRWATRTQQSRNRSYVRLSPSIARAIRLEYGGDSIRGGIIRQVDLAQKYGVSQGMISAIIRGANWREQEGAT